MVHADVDQPALDRASDDREPDRRRKDLGEERDHIDVQDSHVPLFDRLRRLLPGRSPDGAFARGTHALDRGHLDVAQAAFDDALAQTPDASDVARIRNKLAIVALRRDGLAAAVDQLVLALEANPRSPEAIATVGNLLLEDGALEEAIAHYEYALLIDDAYAPACHNLGVALHRSGRKGEAVRMLRKATRLEARMKRA